MFDDRGSAHRELFRDPTDRPLSVGQHIQDPSATWIDG